MPNDFSSDPTCKALWRFEPDALYDDSIGGNNFVTNSGSPASDTPGTEGSGCLGMHGGSVKIDDANLDSDFPLKSSVNGLFTLCFWWDANWGTYGILRKDNWPAGIVVRPDIWGGNFRLVVKWGDNSNLDTFYTLDWVFNTGYPYHIALRVDPTNRIFNWRCYDTFASTVRSNSFSPTRDLVIPNTQFQVGGNDPSQNQQCDEMVVFDRLLSDDEIDQIRNGTYSSLLPPANSTSLTKCDALADNLADVYSLTSCQDMLPPYPDDLRSPTTCEAILAINVDCRSLTRCQSIPVGGGSAFLIF